MSNFLPEDLNFLLELLVAQKRYETVMWILTNYYGIGLDVVPDPDVLGLSPSEVLVEQAPLRFKELLTRSKMIVVPDSYPYDVRSKLAVCLIQLDIYWLAEVKRSPHSSTSSCFIHPFFSPKIWFIN
jgi:hypothetical protein